MKTQAPNLPILIATYVCAVIVIALNILTLN